MKMERLIGILSILIQRKKVTAPELAEQFEVSRRTIQRDIESLCRAGIPITTSQGASGGISIMEGYRVDRTLLTAPEMQAILAFYLFFAKRRIDADGRTVLLGLSLVHLVCMGMVPNAEGFPSL